MAENFKRLYRSRLTVLDLFSLRFSVAFCIIFYLTCTAPSLWIIHVDTANRKLFRLAENKLNVRTRHAPSLNISDKSQAGLHYVLRTSTPLILSIGHIDCHDKVTGVRKSARY